MGAIAEAAAERIGANALLVRIGAYFHDIGKMLKPHYFVENQIGSTSRHANLAPAMSTLIIIGHVKDGIDLGRQHHLPERIIDLTTGRVAGYEGLSRFPADSGRRPDEWFDLARRCGLGPLLQALALRRMLEIPGRPNGTNYLLPGYGIRNAIRPTVFDDAVSDTLWGGDPMLGDRSESFRVSSCVRPSRSPARPGSRWKP